MIRKYFTYGGVGDHVLWLGLLANVKCHRIVRCDDRMADLVRLYEGRSYDELVVGGVPLAQGDEISCWHPAHIGNELDYLSDEAGNIGQMIRTILGLPPDTPIAPPIWPVKAVAAARRRFAETGLPWGRVVVLAPWAHSAEAALPMSWWEDAAWWFSERGRVVVTNVANRARGFDNSREGPVLKPIHGTVAVDVPLSEIGPFAEQCGAGLTARSGLCDVLARVPIKLGVVWPEDPARRMFHEKHFAVWSVAQVYDAPAVREISVNVEATFTPEYWSGWL